jgi:AraC family transcriptional regulator
VLIQSSAGEHFGTVVRARRAGEFLLRESRYDAAIRMPTHHHPRAYFCFVHRGGLRERRADRDFDFTAGSVHFHPAGEPHRGRMGPEGATCLSIIPQESLAGRVEALATAPSSGAPLDRVSSLASRCWTAFHADDSTSDLSLEAAALELLATSLRLPTARGARPPEWLRAVRDHLDDHYLEPISMRDLASLVGVHEVHLPRAFRRHFGATPGAYVRRLRIEAARRALIDTRDPLVEIALAAGFSSQAHLTRLFCREIGVPPGAYRRRHGRGN